MGWQFWIDRGGTFTDVVARRPDGTLTSTKLLSENKTAYEDSAVAGIRHLLGVGDKEPFPNDKVDIVKMGTTVATNALLERRGEPTVLAITQGFGDALTIGTQHRPDLFALNIVRPPPLYSHTVEIRERVLANGDIDTPLDEGAVAEALQAAFDDGYRALAIALLHADRYPEHERQVADIAREIGFSQVSASHDVIPLMRLVSRGDTTVADAYLSPILRRYVDQTITLTNQTPVLFMQSNGGLVEGQKFRGKDAILSGPAGGIVGMAGIAADAGYDNVIGFDMGGTSTDVSHYAGSYERTQDTTIGGVRLRTPMMNIHTVAAGGGSRCIFDGLRFRVGPESAGASPGPACYRQGGPLTITDCNVLLGRIQPNHFPRVFGSSGADPLDTATPKKLFEQLSDEVNEKLGECKPPEALAEGFLAVAVENMANAIKTISVQRGYDVAEYTLVSFGGAGGQHACAVADALGMSRILIHPFAGVLSAYGMGRADLRVLKQQTIAHPLEKPYFAKLNNALSGLRERARAELCAQGVPKDEVATTDTLLLRYEGSDTTIDVPADNLNAAAADFTDRHAKLFGFVQLDKTLVVEAITCEAVGGGDHTPHAFKTTRPESDSLPAAGHVRLWAGGGWTEAPVIQRDAMPLGDVLKGPALVIDANSTTFVDCGWQAESTPGGNLVLTRHESPEKTVAIGTSADPIMIEIFNSLYMAIAEQMGATLQNTAHSVNIKERLDFSCAVFDHRGGLVANAPHMPVHLGSMGESVRAVIAKHRATMTRGQAFITNAPYNGGTHLPDVTVVMPVYPEGEDAPAFFVAARGHHADIGGLTPGSMPPDSTSIEQEGILFDAEIVLDKGALQEGMIHRTLTDNAYPARNPQQNLADIRAQIAACAKGSDELLRMIGTYGLDTVKAYTQHVQDNAEEAVRRVISVLKDGAFRGATDEGGTVAVTISIDKDNREAHVDFTGTSEQRKSNYNAPAAICRAAVLYVFRTLVDDPIPMNEGCLRPINITIPEGSMLDPVHPAAVVAGNVETSQIICDALYGALGRLAASQGTMNNLTFGNATHQYYETICGGSGAGPGFRGADAVQTHMTNSRLTDAEVLEWRYPVVVETFGVRRNSGGEGAHRGGDGAVRRIRFLDDMNVSILSGRRKTAPHGLAGGHPGLPGRAWIERPDGTRKDMEFSDRADLRRGDIIVVETPGGGGYGPPKSDD